MESGIVGIDIGASNIKGALGLIDPKHKYIDIIAVTILPSIGIQDGLVTYRDKLLQAIKHTIERLKKHAQCDIEQVMISISSRHFYTLDVASTVKVLEGRVTHKDILAVVAACHNDAEKLQAIQTGYSITHTLPQDFILDHELSQDAPWSQPALELGIQAHLVYGHRETLKQIWYLSSSLQAPILDVTCDLLAQVEGLIDHTQAPNYQAILDIGSETTKILITKKGKPIFFFCRQQGGVHITQEIQRQFKIADFDEAEHIKFHYGRVYIDADERNEERIPIHGEGPIRYVRQESLSRILERTITENLSALRVRLEEAGVAHLLADGILLTGGSANIPKISDLASDILQTKVRLGRPQQNGVNDLVYKPQFATVYGLVVSGLLRKHDQWFSSWQRELKDIPAPTQYQKKNNRLSLQTLSSLWKRSV